MKSKKNMNKSQQIHPSIRFSFFSTYIRTSSQNRVRAYMSKLRTLHISICKRSYYEQPSSQETKYSKLLLFPFDGIAGLRIYMLTYVRTYAAQGSSRVYMSELLSSRELSYCTVYVCTSGSIHHQPSSLPILSHVYLSHPILHHTTSRRLE